MPRGKKLPQDNFCRSIAAPLPSPRGQFWKKKKENPLLWGERQFGRHFKRQFAWGSLPPNLRVKNCQETVTVGSQFFKSWFSGRGWGQQLFGFQSPAVHWIARTSSLNCFSCRNPYQTHSLNCLPPFHWKALFSHWKVLRRIPFPKISLPSWPKLLQNNSLKQLFL